MDLKKLFEKAENGTLTYDEFMQAMTANKANFVDLSDGGYVSKLKYDDEIGKLNEQIKTLNGTISTRDTDLATLQQQLNDAGDLNALKQASKDLAELQKKYDKETKSYQSQLSKQAYEFAVKDFANSKKFTSNAAKRDFINSMIAKNLTMENGSIIGASDFVEAYSKDNADAFQKEKVEEKPATPKPTFAASSESGVQHVDDPTGGFANAFHFVPIHSQN